MIPAAESFAPFFMPIPGGPLRLRCARFDVADARGVCVLLNGQTEFIEKYFEVIDDLRRRGFAVVAMDWRGQGGSDRLLANPLKAHIADFSCYDQDLDLLMQAVARPLHNQTGGLLVALGHSMGGHILIRRLHDRPSEFDAAALCAPMIAIQPRFVPWWMVRPVSWMIDRGTSGEDFVWGLGQRDHLSQTFAQQIVTSDPVRYQRTHDLLVADPALRLNGPTWSWLGAALRSILLLHSPGYAEAITTPTILFDAGNDKVCNCAALQRFAARMPNGACVEIAGAEHEILMERDIFRDQLWAGFDAFMAQNAKRRSP
jgi:lysophospholipase